MMVSHFTYLKRPFNALFLDEFLYYFSSNLSISTLKQDLEFLKILVVARRIIRMDATRCVFFVPLVAHTGRAPIAMRPFFLDRLSPARAVRP